MGLAHETAKVHGYPIESVRRWLFTTNHKDIGVLYIASSLYFLVVGGALGLLVRLQLIAPGMTLLSPGAFNQATTVHGLVMVLWFLSPLAFGLANYVVPLQIGTRDLAFPRINALSYWLYLFGGLLAAIGFFTPGGAIDTGWTVYAPLNSLAFSRQLGVTLGGAGLLLLIASVTMSSVNFLVTIFRLRAPGMTLSRVPLYTWGVLLTVFMMLFAFPSLAAGVLLLASDRLLGTVFFTSAEGGSVLWGHLFWFFGHPEVYIVFMPALFAMAEILPVFARRPLYGRRIFIVAAVIASVMSFIVWAHHMFVTGIDPGFRKFMTITTEAISIPFGIMILMFVLTLAGGRLRFRTPMLFTLGAIALFIVGGITGVFNSSVALDYSLRGTYWIVGHFHYTLVGGATMGLVAALYYWWPKITGRMFSERLGKLHFVVYIVSFNILFFPLQLLVDMPRRVYTYAPETGWGLLNLVASVGGVLFGLSWLLLFANLYRSLKRGAPAGDNPWDSWSLEWLVASPPPRHNFDGTPIVEEDGRIAVAAASADPPEAQGAHVSPWPLIIGLGAFVAFLGIGVGLPVILLGAALVVGSVVGWGRDDIAARFVAPEPTFGERWPFAKVEKVRLGVWFFLFGEIVLFGSLIGSYLFVRTSSATWPAPGSILDVSHGATNTFILLTSSLTAVLALAAIRMGSQIGLRLGLAGTALLGVWFLANKASEWSTLIGDGFAFSSGLPGSTFFVTTGVHGAHVAAGIVALAYLLAKAFKGRFRPEDHGAVEYFGLYWHFVDIVWVFLFPLLYLV